jgi:hypothetical protein
MLPDFITGFFIGFVVAAVLVSYFTSRTIRDMDQFMIQPLADQIREIKPHSQHQAGLSAANADAERLAHALESGIRAGWPFSALIVRALDHHYQRIGRREIEPSPRLN